MFADGAEEMADKAFTRERLLKRTSVPQHRRQATLDILETKGSNDSGSEFTLNAVQENPLAATDADTQVASSGGAR